MTEIIWSSIDLPNDNTNVPVWWEVLINDENKWFEGLEKNFESKEYEPMKKLLDLIWDYIDLKLSNDFSQQEKDSIKLIIFSESIKELELWNVIWNIVDKFLTPLKSMIDSFSLEGEDIDSLKTNFDEISSWFEKMWLNNVRETIDKKIEKINNEKTKKSR